MSLHAAAPRSAQRFATGLVASLVVGLALAAILSVPAAVLALNDAQQLVVEAWRLVNQSYVDPQQLESIRWRSLRQKALEQPITRSDQAYGAIEAMLAPLDDPYTRMLRPDEYRALRSNTEGSVLGVGLQLGLRSSDQTIVVIAPLDESPAAEAGIRSGEELVSVDGRSVEELGLESTAAALRGRPGSEALVVLRGSDGRQREVTLRRRKVDLRPVRHRRLRKDGHTFGYLRITQFSEPVPRLVREALVDLASTPPVEGLVLDLRNNSGGLVSAGVAVANSFLDGEPIVMTKDRGGIDALQQASPGSLFDGRMLTLVNGGTASASEILAGALQDDGRSRLAGDRTFGKGLIQTLIPLGDGSGLAVTVAGYLTPDGHDIQSRGLVPDQRLSPPEPLNPGGPDDLWLEEALERFGHELEQLAEGPEEG